MFRTTVRMMVLGCIFAAQMAVLVIAGESNEHIHIKLHVPQIIKKHTHTRTIFKHHFVKPKTSKSISHSPIVHSISASPSTLNLNTANHIKVLPTFSESDGIALGLSKNVWRPSASDYRASELSFVPKKIKIPKKKNPYKVLEVMAEAHAEGHDIPPQIIKKLKPSQLLDDDDDSQTSGYIPDYMLANSDLYNSDDNSDSDSESDSKSDLIYVAPNSDKYKARKSAFIPSRTYLTPTITTLSKKKPKMSYDWIPAGTISTSLSSASSASSDLDSRSEYEPDFKHTVHMLKRAKSRKQKRLSPTLGPSEDHIDFLQMSRKPISIANYTKYKNRITAAGSLNTSI